MKTSVQAHIRKIKAIELNRSKFFLDPLRWIANNQSSLDSSDGLPDFDIDVPMDDEVAAQLFFRQLKYEHDDAKRGPNNAS